MYDLLPGGFLLIGPTVQLADTPQQEMTDFRDGTKAHTTIILLCYAALQYENDR